MERKINLEHSNDAPTLSPEFLLDLMPGKVMDLQITSSSLVRLKLPLIGYEIGRYLILKYPTANLTEYADVLQVGNGVVVRYIVEGIKGECVAFATTIRAITTINDKLIFLQYPKAVENRQLRSAKRQQTHIPAKIEMLKETGTTSGIAISGVIKDISEQGCQFSFKSKGANTKVKKAPILLSIFAGANTPPININAIVRNSRNEYGVVYVGIEFDQKENKALTQLLETMAIDNC